VELAPDYSAKLPLWGCDGSGTIGWQSTKFPPGLLDRLFAWQQEFDDNYHWDSGWRSAQIRDHWASEGGELAADVRAELGTAELVVRLWPLRAYEHAAPAPPRTHVPLCVNSASRGRPDHPAGLTDDGRPVVQVPRYASTRGSLGPEARPGRDAALEAGQT
jgi:hypothetical protein